MVLKTLLPGVPILVTITVAALAAGVYIAFGGLGAVVANDALQAILILAGGTVIAVLAWQAVGSWDAVVEAAPPAALHLMQPANRTTRRCLGQACSGYLTPPVVAVFVLGLFWRRANAAGALAGLVIGVPLGAIGWVAVELLDLGTLHFLYAATGMFVVGILLVVAGSLVTGPPPEKKIQDHMWRTEDYFRDAEAVRALPWYQDYRLQSVALAIIAFAVVVWWW